MKLKLIEMETVGRGTTSTGAKGIVRVVVTFDGSYKEATTSIHAVEGLDAFCVRQGPQNVVGPNLQFYTLQDTTFLLRIFEFDTEAVRPGLLPERYVAALHALKDLVAAATTSAVGGNYQASKEIQRQARSRKERYPVEVRRITDVLTHSKDPALTIHSLDERRLAKELGYPV
jgi:hypothetical protein